MANQIRLKRASGSDPGASDLVLGEPAVRTDTGEIFLKKDDGSIAKVAGGIDDGDKGDITVSNDGGTFTIDSGVITNAKVSGSAAIAVSKLSGVMPLAGGTFSGDVIFSGDGTNITFDKSADDLIFNDGAKAAFGTSSDLTIRHTGSHSIINNSTGDLRIESDRIELLNNASSEFYITCTANGSVAAYHDNTKRIETTSSGASITGALDVDGTITCNDVVTAGALLHEGDTNTLVHFDANDQISLKTNGSTRLQVVNSGINVTGNIELSTHLDMPDNAIIKLGTGDDLQLFHDGANSIIDDAGTGVLAIRSDTSVDLLKRTGNEPMLKAFADGSVELYYDNSQKLYTTADGIESKGELHFKSPSNFNGEQTGRIEWWNENDAGVMAKIGVDRKSSTGAPADLVFSTSQNVDTSANGSDGDITERVRVSNNGLRLTNQPCFYAYSNATRNNYGGGIVVAYLATHHNQGNHYSTSTYRFTAPVDGIYVFGGNPGYVESGQTYSLYLRINGAVRTEVGRVVQGNFPSHSQFGFSVSVKLSANDYVDLYQLGRMHHNASYSAWWGYFLG